MQANRKIVFAAALMLVAVAAWVVASSPRGAASPQNGIDPLQMMGTAQALPAAHYDFF
jgi:hypothetical protein